jgi:hypothetical protein
MTMHDAYFTADESPVCIWLEFEFRLVASRRSAWTRICPDMVRQIRLLTR